MKIAIGAGMAHLEEKLMSKGYDVVPYRDSGMDIKIAIVNDIDEEYEEIDPVTFYGNGESEMILLNASRLSEDQVMIYVEKYTKQLSNHA